MFKISQDTKRVDHFTDDRFNLTCLKKNRAQAYLFKEFNDVNLEHDYIPLMGDELVEQIVSFFVNGSKLIYPAKSYFVAITYASIICSWSPDTSFIEALSDPELLKGDKYFKPYGKETREIYDEVTRRLLDYLRYQRNLNVMLLTRPEGEIWRVFESCKPTLRYFFEEFLFENQEIKCITRVTFYTWEGSDV